MDYKSRKDYYKRLYQESNNQLVHYKRVAMHWHSQTRKLEKELNMTRIIAFCVCIFLATLAFGDTPTYVYASVKVSNGGTSCSGTIISNPDNAESVYGTCAAHCFVGRIGGKFWIHFPYKHDPVQATLVAMNKEIDVAIWKCPSEGVAGFAPVPKTWQSSGFVTRAVGYPNGVGPNWKEVTYGAQDNSYYHYNVKSGHFWHGDSGGGVYLVDKEQNGYLVGVISARESHASHKAYDIHATHPSQLYEFVRKWCPPGGGCNPGYQDEPAPPPEWSPNPNIPIDPPSLDKDQDRRIVIREILERLEALEKSIPEAYDPSALEQKLKENTDLINKNREEYLTLMKELNESHTKTTEQIKNEILIIIQQNSQDIQTIKDILTNQPQAAEQNIIYFTAESHPNVRETDEKIRYIRKTHNNIRAVTLRPEEAKVQDIPRLFLWDERRSIVGREAVLNYLDANF